MQQLCEDLGVDPTDIVTVGAMQLPRRAAARTGAAQPALERALSCCLLQLGTFQKSASATSL
jgi:hypothetical protein